MSDDKHDTDFSIHLNDTPHFMMPACTSTGLGLEHNSDEIHLWHSICSQHRSHNNECPRCQVGSWVKVKYVREKE